MTIYLYFDANNKEAATRKATKYRKNGYTVSLDGNCYIINK